MAPKNSNAATVNVGNFTFDTGFDVPSPARGGSGQPSELSAKLDAMPEGSSFLEGVAMPDIKDEGEREKKFKEDARQVQNRIGSATRRVKKNHPERVYVARVVNDEKMGVGVRVWRKPDEELANPGPSPEAEALPEQSGTTA